MDGAAILSAWSMEASPNGDMGWTQIESLSLGSCSLLVLCPQFVGCADGIGAFFVEQMVDYSVLY